jgi:mono/diheme cytochrome c family protein
MSNPPKGAVTLTIAAGLFCVAWKLAIADTPSTSSRVTTRAATGADVYEHICQGCHMPQAQGAVGAGAYPKLANNPAVSSWQYVATMVLNGRAGMPAFGTPADGSAAGARTPTLSDAQVAAVVNYVRTNFGNHYRSVVTEAEIGSLPHLAGKGSQE